MKIVIVSGYFNPLHGGHLDMINAAAKMGDKLVVIVNNDAQQLQKKGKIILDEANRLRLMKALRHVDEVVLSVDDAGTPSAQPISQTLALLAQKYPNDELIFANGGDRNSTKAIPETAVCQKYGIVMRFDAGVDKPDSSTRINQALGWQD
jgi:glycerol-3-phosphate cytidylyltransferase/D-beta-D-heptose 7-phosphate kinase/D-beta-D-heptose 1-phosphate adenosyltransferase